MFLRSPSKLVSLNKLVGVLGLASTGVLMCLSATANSETLIAQDINQPEVILANEVPDLKKPEEVVPQTPSVTDTVVPSINTQADTPPTDTTVPTTPTDMTTPTDTTVPTTPTDTTVPTTPTDTTTPTEPDSTEAKNIVETAKSAGSFTTLTKALEAAGLVETLAGNGPFTVFAPTDEAFAALPEGTLEKLMMPENKEQLIKVLSYHVVSGTISFKDIQGTQEGQVPTVEGNPLDIVASSDEIKVNDAKVTQSDISASNGLIQVVDKVILPPDLKL
jgi:uncharacterized surface protein with fasciclin (FAS1) repeats